MQEDHIVTETYKLSDVWQFFLEAVCRFWTNRFKYRVSPELQIMKDELEYLRRENAKLVSSLISLSSSRAEDTELNSSIEEMKPIRQFQPSWSEKKRQLEADARQRANKIREDSEDASRSLDSDLHDEISKLEAEVGIQ